MLSQRDKSVIINILDEILGVGTSLRGNEQAHHCPFCHHHKKKLQVNLEKARGGKLNLKKYSDSVEY